ncbi:hypothetical protein Ancab_040282 [Ancistrocladus abbreviatus]
MALQSRGYAYSKNDYSLFSKCSFAAVVFVAIYVDDILLTGSDTTEIHDLKQYIDYTFKSKDLSPLHYFLGLEILQEPDGGIITQHKFARDLLRTASSSGIAVMPLAFNLKLLPDHGEHMTDPLLYRQLIGKLNFLTNTCPYLSFALQYLSQFMKCPQVPHFQALQHTLNYFHGTPDHGLFMSKVSDFSLRAYCDSNWASCPFSRKSVSGYFVMLGTNPLCWKSKK